MSNIQIQLMSDLHLEAPASYDIYEIPSKAPILALLGDIGQARDPGYTNFLERQLSLFRTVLLVLGNHEPYHSSWDEVHQRIQSFKETFEHKRTANQGSLILLDRTRFDVSDDLTILGCTLHSYIEPEHEAWISLGMNDFYHIKDWDVEKHRQAHKEDLDWLNDQVTSLARNEPNRRVAIFTHHSPSTHEDSMDPKHAMSANKSAFSTDLSSQPCWKGENVKLWAFGHTHFNCDFVDSVTGKQVVTNQRGYYFAQADGFDESRVFTL